MWVSSAKMRRRDRAGGPVPGIVAATTHYTVPGLRHLRRRDGTGPMAPVVPAAWGTQDGHSRPQDLVRARVSTDEAHRLERRWRSIVTRRALIRHLIVPLQLRAVALVERRLTSGGYPTNGDRRPPRLVGEKRRRFEEQLEQDYRDATAKGLFDDMGFYFPAQAEAVPAEPA